jgi:hypothetical protein
LSLEKTKKKLRKLLSQQAACKWIKLLPVIQTIDNIKVKLRLIENTHTPEELLDTLCELRYALIFKYLGFDVKAEPLGGGPDFQVNRDGATIMVECMRFRHVYNGPSEESPSDQLSDGEYGDIKRDTEKVRSKIQYKYHQISDHNTIITIWNDDGDIEELEVSKARRILIEDSVKEINALPEGLIAVVYASNFKMQTSAKQIYCYELKEPTQPTHNWLIELRKVDVDQALNQLASNPSP